MPNGRYGGVRGKETKVGQKTFVSRPTRLRWTGRTSRVGRVAGQVYQVGQVDPVDQAGSIKPGQAGREGLPEPVREGRAGQAG